MSKASKAKAIQSSDRPLEIGIPPLDYPNKEIPKNMIASFYKLLERTVPKHTSVDSGDSIKGFRMKQLFQFNALVYECIFLGDSKSLIPDSIKYYISSTEEA